MSNKITEILLEPSQIKVRFYFFAKNKSAIYTELSIGYRN